MLQKAGEERERQDLFIFFNAFFKDARGWLDVYGLVRVKSWFGGIAQINSCSIRIFEFVQYEKLDTIMNFSSKFVIQTPHFSYFYCPNSIFDLHLAFFELSESKKIGYWTSIACLNFDIA